MKWLAGGCLFVLLAVVSMAGAMGAQPPTLAGAQPSAAALGDIPADMLALYRAAGERYSLDWAVLAAIGKVESNHNRPPCPVSSAGAVGPMQFLPSTWATYGDGGDICDPAAAIPATARYLIALGAPDNYHDAVRSYNGAGPAAEAYAAKVLAQADAYRAAQAMAPAGPPTPLEPGASWLATVPGTAFQCDARIVPDVVAILARYHAQLTACFAPTGHAAAGEHPLGLGTDIVPGPGGSWDLIDEMAADFGWHIQCGGTGCAGQLPPPFRFIGWRDYPGHGPPSQVGASAHIHLSWMHSPAAPGTPAATVQTLAG